MSELAINGGEKVITKPFPDVGDISGRYLGQEEKELLIEVINSGHLNRVGGTKVSQFEKEFAERYGVRHAIASSSGTAALHIALGALALNPGDEVITTTITDMGTVIAILLCNAIPIFADVDPLTCNIDPESIEGKITEKTRVIIPVHLFGQPSNMDPIIEIAKRHNLYIVEDCCQAHLAEYKGEMVGTMGDIGCFSFQQIKQITTGDGGMTIMNDDELAERSRLFSDKGWPRTNNGQRDHLFLGPNYRMTELQGAVGIAQIRKIDSIVQKRRETAQFLTNLIKNIEGVNPPKIIEGAIHSWWNYSFTINEELLKVSSRDFQNALNAEGIPFHVGYIPNPIFSYEVIKSRKTYGTSHCPWDCPQARQNIQYKKEDYPNTMKAIEKVFVMNWNEGITYDNSRDIGNGLEKVAAYFQKRIRALPKRN